MTVVTPEQWYIAFWCSLTMAVCVFVWFAGPHIIAKGLELWIRHER